MKVTAVDAGDDQAYQEFFDTWLAGSLDGRTDPALWTAEELRVDLLRTDGPDRTEAYVVRDGDRPIGAGQLTFHLQDNVKLAEFAIAVLPAERRRGAGSAMFEHLVARAEAEGRTSLLTEVAATAGTEKDHPAVSFLTHRGLTLRNTEVRRQLDLPVPAETLESLARKASEACEGYRLASWQNTTPDEYADQYAHLKGLLMTEAPTGEVDYEPEVWDVARLRAEEERARLQRRTTYTTVAIAPDGTIAGHTQAAVPGADPGRAFQWDTLVLGAHRGHRLGLAVKVENLRRLQADHPEVTRISTWNAEQNGPMINVNEQLGYRVLEVIQEWQR